MLILVAGTLLIGIKNKQAKKPQSKQKKNIPQTNMRINLLHVLIFQIELQSQLSLNVAFYCFFTAILEVYSAFTFKDFLAVSWESSSIHTDSLNILSHDWKLSFSKNSQVNLAQGINHEVGILELLLHFTIVYTILSYALLRHPFSLKKKKIVDTWPVSVNPSFFPAVCCALPTLNPSSLKW